MKSLAAFDDPVEVKYATSSVIPNGFFTLTLFDGGHKTFRIHTKRRTSKFAPGKRVIGLLIGPDNTQDFSGFGFVDDAGIHVWRGQSAKMREYAAVLWALLTGHTVNGYAVEVSKRCLVCGRVLTTPTSLASGIGETCLEKYGG